MLLCQSSSCFCPVVLLHVGCTLPFSTFHDFIMLWLQLLTSGSSLHCQQPLGNILVAPTHQWHPHWHPSDTLGTLQCLLSTSDSLEMTAVCFLGIAYQRQFEWRAEMFENKHWVTSGRQTVGWTNWEEARAGCAWGTHGGKAARESTEWGLDDSHLLNNLHLNLLQFLCLLVAFYFKFKAQNDTEAPFWAHERWQTLESAEIYYALSQS